LFPAQRPASTDDAGTPGAENIVNIEGVASATESDFWHDPRGRLARGTTRGLALGTARELARDAARAEGRLSRPRVATEFAELASL